MKKEGKSSVTSGRTIGEGGKLGRHNQRSTAGEKAMFEKSPKDRMRSQYDITSPSNKENQAKTANLELDGLSSPQCPLSPLQCLSPKGALSPSNFVSPSRTTPLESLDALRSNKGKEELNPSASSSILFSGYSKDGRHKVQSHCLEGEELVQACEYERKVNFSTRLQSKKRGNPEGIPAIDPARTSIKENGVIKSYAVNTHSGISRNYNEDRVSITLNIKKKGVRAQFFAIYDGHGGSLFCDYLKDNLHELLIGSHYFPSDPKRALAEAISKSETQFGIKARNTPRKDGLPDRSGSCAIAVLTVDDLCYVANVGDSRAIMSTEGGKMAFNLSRDHKPSDSREQERILAAGGKVYRTEMVRLDNKKERIIGPLRIMPGKLSVSRTIGDIEGKEPEFGGRKGVISHEPDIRKFRLAGKEDFIILCCDGILERMESMETVEVVWAAMRQGGSMHEKAGRAVDGLIEESMRRRSADNLTAIVLCLRQLGEQHYRSPRKAEHH